MSKSSQVDHFIREVCSQIKCKEVHYEITMELSNHIEDLRDQLMEAGLTEDEAIEKALLQMGDPLHVGRQLHQIHKPKTDWGLLATVIGFAIFALIVMFSLVNGIETYAKEFTSVSEGWLSSKALYSVIAIALGTFLFFIDYRRLTPYLSWMYVGTVLGMVLLRIFGTPVNGRHMFILPFTVVDFLGVCPYLLLIGFAGFAVKWDWSKRRTIVKAVASFAIPDFIFFVSDSMHFFTLWIVFLVMMILIKAKSSLRKTILLLSTSAVMTLFAILWSKGNYTRERLTAFLNPDNLGYNYQTNRSIESLYSAGWWGNGFGSWPEGVPGIESELIFTYVVYAFGWIVGALLLLGIMYFIARLMKLSMIITEPFGRLYLMGVASLFMLQFLINILGTLGYTPIIEYTLPFFSHGGSQLVVQMMVIGMALSVYRHKDMPPKFNARTKALKS